MKVYKLVIAGLVALFATSCYKSDIENLQKQIDALKGGEIATLESQVAAINTTVGQLQSTQTQLQGYISELQKDSQTYKSQISELQGADIKLGEKIAELKTYADTEIGNVKTWAEGTFATLDQMDSLSTVVASVVSKVGEVEAQLDSAKKQITEGYVKAIKEAVAASESSMKKWVNEQLADYYTIAQINATLDSLGKKQSKIDSAMVEKLKEQRVALDTAKSQITAAYKSAIKVAIDSLGGKFDIKLATEIATAKNALQTQIDSISGEISNIKSRLAAVENNIAALLVRIQSVRVIPQYSDGSVLVSGRVDTISFDVHPQNVAEAIAAAWKAADEATRANMVSFKIQEVMTKSTPTAIVDTVFFKDNEFKVGVMFQNLPTNAMASLHIASGKTDVSSIFFGLNQTEEYFYFEAVNAGAKVALVIPAKTSANPPTAPSLLYSTDGGTNWTDYTISDTIPAGGLTAGQRIYFKAKTTNTAFGATGSYDYYYFATTDLVKVGGNIMYLLNGSDPDAATVSPHCFKSLFDPSNGPEGFRQSFIVSASDLKLPATKLSENCYRRMFASCGMLKTAPALPAKELADTCYYQMFTSCLALKAAPALPATTLKTLCYCAMFQSCTTLVAAPPLPATELAISCYNQMFDKCYALVTAPALTAKTLANKCYFKMFCDCSALENPPALPATELADNCYDQMFTSCSTLVAAPPLPATQLKKECYKKMFSKCVKLSSVTMLATDVSAEDCLTEWLAYGAGEDASVTSRTLTINTSLNPNATNGAVKTIKDNSAGWDITNGTTTAFAYEKVGWGIPITTGTAPSQTTTVWAPVNCGYDATNYIFGKLYQWGRKDGCGYNDSSTYTETIIQTATAGPVAASSEDASKFYTVSNSNDLKDWLNPQDTVRWNSNTEWPGKEISPTKTNYDPCPTGWRVPTRKELNNLTAHKSNWTSNDSQNGYWFSGGAEYSESAPRVFLPAAGKRAYNGTYSFRNNVGSYWSSSIEGGTNSYFILFLDTDCQLNSTCRANGYPVRCIKE